MISPLMAMVREWPTPPASAAVVTVDGIVDLLDTKRRYPWASVTKLATALVVLDAVDDRILSLDDPAGPKGSTVRHLLAHTSGLGLDGGHAARVGARRVYSNAGYELAADLVVRRVSTPFAPWMRERLFRPLGMSTARLESSPAHGGWGSILDLVALARELLVPTVLGPNIVLPLSQPAFPGLSGVLPGFGKQDDNLWGLGAEIKDHKHPHWTGSLNSPTTFGHFGQSGSFLWVDPEIGVAAVALTGQPFGAWATEAWPAFADEICRRHAHT